MSGLAVVGGYLLYLTVLVLCIAYAVYEPTHWTSSAAGGVALSGAIWLTVVVCVMWALEESGAFEE